MRWSSHNSFLTQLISAQLVGYGIFVALFSHTSGCGEDQWCNVPCSTLMTLSPYRRFYSFLSDSYICCGSRSWYQSAFGLDTPTSKGRSFSFPKSTCIYVQSCFRSFICPSTREKYPFPVISEFFQKAGEACQLVCDVMAPRDGKALFQAVLDHEQKCKTAFDVGLPALLIAFRKNPLKSWAFMLIDSQPTRLKKTLFDKESTERKRRVGGPEYLLKKFRVTQSF